MSSSDSSSGEEFEIVAEPSGPSRPQRSDHAARPPPTRVNGASIYDVDDEEAIIPMHFQSAMASSGSATRQHYNASNSSLSISHPSISANGSEQAKLQANMARLGQEINSVEDEIRQLQGLLASLRREHQDEVAKLKRIRGGGAPRPGHLSQPQPQSTASSSRAAQNAVEYMDSRQFEWSRSAEETMRRVWGIQSFRLCQEGVVNANLSGRDVLCVMPTGGGKSLTYQLPALLSPGTTVVISPLVSLITDQVMHLREAGVECVMLTGSIGKAEQNDALRRMTSGAQHGQKEIKLCYVTPEKVAKSKTFVSALSKVHGQGRLARIVIDEAHCCSQMGHDFRPDYKKLSALKQFFPNTPILAVTATLSGKVKDDVLKILQLGKTTPGRSASPYGTVFFSSPLFRPNLFYKVVPKPSNAKKAVQQMADYIVDNHLGENGIVYCLSKKDSADLARGLQDASGGRIKTGVYNADIGDAAKEQIHRQWREGKIHCVCATIAFGLGIDNPNTRYVLHHSLSKSVDGYYQESGRAGRDGKAAECVLFYRGQDASRILALTVNETGGQSKVHEMLRYAEDLETCRKVAFATYFSASSVEKDATPDTAPCGHCDNCNKDGASTEVLDVTLDSWKIIKIITEVSEQGGRVTIASLADLARGLGGGSYTVSSGTKGKKRAAEERLDLEKLCGGKVSLTGNQAESLVIRLILDRYLREDFQPTAYTCNVYVIPGPKAVRLGRFKRNEIDANPPVTLTHRFRVAEKPKRVKKVDRLQETDGESSSNTKRKRTSSTAASSKKQKKDSDKSASTSGQDVGDVRTPSDLEAWTEFQRGQRSETEPDRGTRVVEIDSDGLTVSEAGWKSDFDF